MRATLYRGSLYHRRLSPVGHAFTYPVRFYGLPLAELSNLTREVRGFSHNAFNVVSLRDRDYLEAGPEPLIVKLTRRLQSAGLVPDAGRTVLFTALRHFGYVFNPVSFYVGFDAAGDPQWVLAEVNNTFQDRHVYLLPALRPDGRGGWTAAAAKAFHVSPFNDRAGEYRFRFAFGPDRAEFHVDLWKDGAPYLEARMTGLGEPLTSGSLLRSVLRHPVQAALTFPRIVVQAAWLKFRRKLAWHPRPVPDHPDTIRTREHSGAGRTGGLRT